MKNHLTFQQLDSTCMALAGNLTQNDIKPILRQTYINNALMKMYRILDSINDPWYDKSTTLTVTTTDQEFLGSADVSVINASTFAITRGTGLFATGEILSISLITKASGAVAYQWLALVTSGGATATWSTISGTAATYNSSTQSCSVIGWKTFSGTTADVSAYYFKDFTCISDLEYTAGVHTVQRVFYRYKDIQKFSGLATDPSSANIIAWYQRGDTIVFFVGSTANALGTVTGIYRGKPTLFSDATLTNAIDIPPEDNQILIDEVTSKFLIDQGKAVPVSLQEQLANWSKAAEAAALDRQKAAEIKNK